MNSINNDSNNNKINVLKDQAMFIQLVFRKILSTQRWRLHSQTKMMSPMG